LPDISDYAFTSSRIAEFKAIRLPPATSAAGDRHSPWLPLRPVEALQAWLAAAEITSGPIFRPVWQGDRVSAASPSAFSAADRGHSLRAGFLTSAAEHGASVWKMMEVSRHRSVDTLRGYVRRVCLHLHFADGAAGISDV
jgi:hypothetical protein